MQVTSRTIREEANDRTRQLHGQQGAAAGEFLCECGDEQCHSFVWLTLAEFELLRTAGLPVFGHRDESGSAPISRPAL